MSALAANDSLTISISENIPVTVINNEQKGVWVSETNAFQVFNTIHSSPHWNESKAPHASFLPELFCAVQFPWYMLGRVYTKAALPRPELFTIAMFILSVLVYITYGLQNSVGPIISLLGIISAIILFIVTVLLRQHVRNMNNINGSLQWDMCAVFPWMCGLPCQGYTAELASMDRQLSPSISSQTTAISPRSKWSSGIFECGLFSLTGSLPQFLCAVFYPFFIKVRLLYRLGLGGACKALSILALQVFVPLILLFIALAIKSGTLVIVSLVLYASNAIGIFFHAWLRTYVRELYSIPGTHSDDALHAIFCWACSLAQLERETSGLNRTEISTLQGNNNGNSKDVPIIPESVSVSVPVSSIPATVIVTPSAPVHVNQ